LAGAVNTLYGRLRRAGPARWRADFKVLPRVTVPGAPVSVGKSFVVEDGNPRLLDG